MAASMENDFDSWLSQKLIELNPDTDVEVFVQYIRSIFETEVDNDEIKDSVGGIIAEITENNIEGNCDEVMKKWRIYQGTQEEIAKAKDTVSFDEQISSIMSQQSQQVTKTKEPTAEDRARRAAKEAILNQYAEVSDGEASESDEETDELVKNVNSKLVVDREKANREKTKTEHEQKKQKDKDDREKQKQKAQERKDNEKKRTQKGERRR